MNPMDSDRSPSDAVVRLVPGHASGAAVPEEAVRRREQALATLLDLSRSCTVSTDLYQQIDMLLFGAMAQLGTSRAALWLVGEPFERLPVLMRCHGFRRSLMLGFGSTLTPGILLRLQGENATTTREELERDLDDIGLMLTRQAGVAVLVSVPSARGPLGLLAVGDPVDAHAYDLTDLQVLETAASILGMALLNSRLHADVAETNRQLRLRNEVLAEMERARSEVFSSVNQELKAPLSVIRATLELVHEGAKGTAIDDQMVRMALEAAGLLRSQMENLLSLTATHGDGPSKQAALVDVGETLARFHQMRLPGVSASLRELVFARAEGLAPAMVDVRAFLRIFDEMVDHAVKFTPPGTRIELRVQADPDAPGERLRIDFSDDGPGVPSATQGVVLENRSGTESADDESDPQVAGIRKVRRLASAIGLDLRVESVPGRGTSFRLRVPVTDRRRHGANGEAFRRAA